MGLNWDKFRALEGDVRRNFELLVRALVQRSYGHCGSLRSKRQQPGVEFHLQLTHDCALATAGRWFGWQCKWYDLPPTRAFGATRRADIAEGIRLSKLHIPGLTDFVLCLRELPTSDDVDWYFGLDTEMHLHLWADEEIEARLSGEAEVIRSTFFGELVLTVASLAEAHSRSIAPIRNRWVPGLNVATRVDLDLRAALLQPGSMGPIRAQAENLRSLAESVTLTLPSLADDERSLRAARTVVHDLCSLAADLAALSDAADEQRPADAVAGISSIAPPEVRIFELRHLARKLRLRRHFEAPAISSIEAELRWAVALIRDLRELIQTHCLAVVADAGQGKSHLAAELTAPHEGLPAGVFVMGSVLRAGGTLDDVAARVPGLGISRFDDLLAGLNAAGARIGARIPLVIDGLNEAERPTDWRALLAELGPVLGKFDNVLVVVTLRTDARNELLPTDLSTKVLQWRELEVDDLVSRYFAHYQIQADELALPFGWFANPLFLRIFCEATNPEHIHPVGVEAIPISLVGVFELYRERAVERIRQRLQLPPGYIEKKLAKVAQALWERGARILRFDDVQAIMDESDREWEHSLVRALEDEGILWRRGGDTWAEQRSAVLFDAFAGYLIADSLIATLTPDDLQAALRSDGLWDRLVGPGETHPLANDVMTGLVGLVPRRLWRRHLWTFANDAGRRAALLRCVLIESSLLDNETVDALAHLLKEVSAPRHTSYHPFDRLWEVRAGPGHLLNARFLDRVLRSLPVTERDGRWTEWVRARAEEIEADLERLSDVWVRTDRRSESDDLNAVAVAWLLTSTVNSVRDKASQTLHRYGLPDPDRMFQLANAFLDVDDMYVVERVLGVSYGVATSHQMPDPGGTFERAQRTFLTRLLADFCGSEATHPTSHLLVRRYVTGLFHFARQLHPGSSPTSGVPLVFAPGDTPAPIDSLDVRHDEVMGSIHMDFGNYSIGALFEGRGNYDYEHPAYKAGMAEVRGRIWELGWRRDGLGKVDAEIDEQRYRQIGRHRAVERYGKKYGWVAYYELAGRIEEGSTGHPSGVGLPHASFDVDPTFVPEPAPLALDLVGWADSGSSDEETWMRTAPVEVPTTFLLPEAIEGIDGPWVLVDAFMQNENKSTGREVFGFLRGLLVEDDVLDTVLSALHSEPYLGNNFIPDSPTSNSVFAGEIPWTERFINDANLGEGLPPYHGQIRRDWREPGHVVELLAHTFSFEARRPETTPAKGYSIVSASIALENGLRLRRHTLDLVELDGRHASLSRGAPAGFTGHTLYVRRDVLARHSRGRTLIQFFWGERRTRNDWSDEKPWAKAVFDDRAYIWRHASSLKP
jgi:hypothetical protein